jgi:6-bladed beta-propeller
MTRWTGAVAILLTVGPGVDRGLGQEPRWQARPLVLAGSLDGPGALGDAFDVEVGPAGEILVSDPRAGAIVVFSGEGRYLRTVGRRGSGPGEFRVAGGMGWKADTLWIVDFGRVHLFDRQIEYVRTIGPLTTSPPTGLRLLLPGPLMADGTLLGMPVDPEPGRSSPIAVLDGEGRIVRVIANVREDGRSMRLPSPAGGIASISNPWSDHDLWNRQADGLAVVVVRRRREQGSAAAEFSILRIGLNGDTLMRRRVEYTPQALTSDQADEAYTQMSKRFTVPGGWTVAQAERNVRSAVAQPAWIPPVSELVPGRDGTIWIRREAGPSDSVDWQVFSRDGEPMGRLALPADFRLRRASVGRIWGVVRDSLDVPFVQVFEVAKPGR